LFLALVEQYGFVLTASIHLSIDFQNSALYHLGMSIGKQLRDAIEESGLSLPEIGRQSGVPQPMLWRFMQGDGIRLDTIERLAKFFGMKLTPAKKPPSKK
jgi:hypothetical protein